MVPRINRIADRIMERAAGLGRPMTQQQAMRMAWMERDRMMEMATPLSPVAAASSAAGGGHVARYGQSEGFVDYYQLSVDPGNPSWGELTAWEIFDGGDSHIDVTGAPEVLVLVGSNDEDKQGLASRLDLTVASQGDGTVSFDWEYSTGDEDAGYDRFQFLLNGEVTAISDPDGALDQSGSYSVQVKAGDVFGFRINPTDNCCGPAVVTISAFRAPKTIN